jgi:uncharacterized protein YdiU (UPF0061 family)
MLDLRFDDRFVRELPPDPETGPRRRQVHGALYSLVAPTPVKSPRLLAHSAEVAELLGLDAPFISSPEFAAVFAGNATLPGMTPYAANYGGHQFGNWAGQLGDGRAITLGELINPGGERWELQLKGAGPTPYSRSADGRAVLRSSIREFLCSEAMFHLGVPTTRALSLVATGEPVLRDMFYDGHAKYEPGAVVCRVAPSFLRFGNFELPSSRGDHALLGQLVDFTVTRFFPHIRGDSVEATRAAWFAEVCERSAELVAQWMRVGFVHGVMNTDNMSILGLTIDYGPYGWIDDFDFDWTPNTTDRHERRYRFGQQAQVAYWNLAQLAQSLLPLFSSPEPLREGLQRYADRFAARERELSAAKLGFSALQSADQALVQRLYALLQENEVDMTIFFRALVDVDMTAPSLAALEDAFYDPAKRAAAAAGFSAWLDEYAARTRAGAMPPEMRRRIMRGANPRFVLRNYLAQQAIDRAEAGDFAEIGTLLEVLRRPYEEQPERAAYAQKRPDWARSRPGCSMLSCSS